MVVGLEARNTAIYEHGWVLVLKTTATAVQFEHLSFFRFYIPITRLCSIVKMFTLADARPNIFLIPCSFWEVLKKIVCSLPSYENPGSAPGLLTNLDLFAVCSGLSSAGIAGPLSSEHA